MGPFLFMESSLIKKRGTSKHLGYKKLWAKVQTRDRKILKLRADVESLKAYATKRSQYYRIKKYALRDCQKKVIEVRNENKDIATYIRAGFDRKNFELLDYTLRYRSVVNLVKDEATEDEIFILVFLSNVDFATQRILKTKLNFSTMLLLTRTKSLELKGFIKNQKSYGTNNYIYITEEGKKVVRSFVELMKKTQQFNKQ